MTTLTTPWAYPTSSGQFGAGVAWQFVENLIGDTPDTRTRSGALYTEGGPSAYLYAAGFGFALPAGAVLTGLEIEIRAKAEVSAFDYYWSDAFVITEPALPEGATNLLAAPVTIARNPITAYQITAPATDAGITLTPALINAAGFGIAIAFYGTAGNKDNDQASIYTLRLRLSYVQGEAPDSVDLSAQGITADSPVLGSPELAPVANSLALTALPLSTGAAQTGTPALGQKHSLGAPGLLAPLADLATPALGTRHRLLAQPPVTEAPELTRPSLRLGISATRVAGTLALLGQAQALTASPARSAISVPLTGAALARAMIGASDPQTPGRLALGVTGTGRVEVGGAALSALDVQRHFDAESQIDVTAARSLAVTGHAAAHLALGLRAASLVSVDRTAKAALGVDGAALPVFKIQRQVAAASPLGATLSGSLAVTGHAAAHARGGLTAAAGLSLRLASAGLSRAALQAGSAVAITGVAEATGLAQADFAAAFATPGTAAGATPAAGRAAPAIAITATLFAAARLQAAVILSPAVALRATALAGLSARQGGDAAIAGQARSRTSIAADFAAASLPLAGQAVGTVLQPRLARASGQLDLDGQTLAPARLQARGGGAILLSGSATATSATSAAFAGQLSLARDLGADLLVTASSGRAIALAGAGRADLRASARAQAIGPELGGRAVARGRGAVTGLSGLAVLSAGAAQGNIAATGQLEVDLLPHVSGAPAVQAVLVAGVELRAVTDVATAPTARAAGGFAWQSSSGASAATIGGASPGIGIAATARAVMVIRGTARITIEVTRAFTGDVDVLGDSARQFGLGGGASARTTSGTQASQSVVEVTGNARVRAEAEAHCAASIALTGAAKAGVPIAATTSASIGWITEAAATAPRSAQSQGTLSLVGTGQALSAANGAAVAGLLIIAGDLGGATGLIAELQGDLTLEGTAESAASVAARGTGQLSVLRDSNADVQVAGDAARALPLVGTAAGALVARATRADGAVVLGGVATARAQTAASLPKDATLDLQGHATGATRAQAISTGHVAFVRLGLGDVLVAGGAARGMALLGSAQAGNVTRAAANLPLAPQLAGSATNVIRVEFAARDMGVAARGNAMAGVSGKAVAEDLGLVAAAQALRAPPALRRSEPPKYGLSGRLSPTNSGRILRG